MVFGSIHLIPRYTFQLADSLSFTHRLNYIVKLIKWNCFISVFLNWRDFASICIDIEQCLKTVLVVVTEDKVGATGGQ